MNWACENPQLSLTTFESRYRCTRHIGLQAEEGVMATTSPLESLSSTSQ